MNCLIVDDESMYRLALRKLCSKVNFINIVGECKDATEALIQLQNKKVDLIFLDINMPNMTGIEFVRTIRQLPQIIFSTANKECAIEAFEYNITDYLIKPVSYPRFLKAVDRAKAIQNNIVSSISNYSPEVELDILFLKEDGRLTKLNMIDILWIESVGDYAKFITLKQTHTVHSTLKKIEERLPSKKFHKIHRKYIINLNKIVDIEDHSVLIKDRLLPISRRNKPSLMEKLNFL
ncbi:MAG: LytR/AlgR family response regulator transcription factor [Chitinophagales bacterium]